MRRLQFAPYEETEQTPNIVVDGAPNAATVLTLSHWPGIDQPRGLAADVSGAMVFNYLDTPPSHAPAEVATNNHFDQDGLVGVHALIDPETSLLHRERLIDVATAGDFATYTYRESARASMAIWAYALPDRSPLGAQIEGPYPAACALLYETVLPLLVPMVDDPERFRDLWHDEDGHLSASEQAIADGQVTIEEIADLDLAVVSIGVELHGGHRFASDTAGLIHPMAINNATSCCRLLMIRGREFMYTDRYETWVQYQTRTLPQRVDLGPLAEELTSLESRSGAWTASAPSVLTPVLRSSTDSSLDAPTVTAAVVNHLRSSPPAWNPYRRE